MLRAVPNPDPILCFSSIDWDFIWQGHQEIMSTLARQGHRVLFVENTGVRGPRLRDLGRIRHRYSKWHRSTHGFWQVEENLYVYSPLILPFPYSRWARWINRLLMSSALKRWMVAMDFHAGEAGGHRMVGIALHAHDAPVLDGGDERALVGAIVSALGPDDGHAISFVPRSTASLATSADDGAAVRASSPSRYRAARTAASARTEIRGSSTLLIDTR